LFIEFGTRRVLIAGVTAHPHAGWVARQARQFVWSLPERPTPLRFLIRDRDSKFSEAFDEVFRGEGIEIIKTPIRAPQANAYAERFVGTIRRECLDWLLISHRRQLERGLHIFVDHYNSHRPHRSLGLAPPHPRPPLDQARRPTPCASGEGPTRRTDPRIQRRSMSPTELTHPTGRPGSKHAAGSGGGGQHAEAGNPVEVGRVVCGQTEVVRESGGSDPEIVGADQLPARCEVGPYLRVHAGDRVSNGDRLQAG
jgi:hypothetical protein